MRLVAIARNRFEPALADAALDRRFWQELAARLGDIELIVESTGPRFVWEWQAPAGARLRVWGVAATASLGGTLGFILRAGWLARRLAGPDAVVSGSEPFGGLAATVAAFGRAPRLQEVHGRLLELPATYPRWKRTGLRLLTQRVATTADVVRAVSDDVRRQLVTAGVAPTRVHVVGQRCDVDLFDPSRYSAPRNPEPVVGFVGRLVEDKGVDVLLRAFAQVLPDRPCQLVIAGDGRLRKELERLAADLLPSRSYEFTGAIPYDDVPAFLSGLDLVVVPSVSEGMPRVLLEAMSMERCVVATKVGGIAEVVDDSVTGRLVPPSHPDALADALRALLENPAAAHELGRRARVAITERFAFPASMDRLADLFRSATGVRP